jgi:protein O-mannosyl-transferase
LSQKAARARRRQEQDLHRAQRAGTVAGLSNDLRWMALLIAAAVLIAYWPALDGYFLWDDDAHVTRPDLRTLSGLGRIWFDVGATQQYYPLLHSAFWLEHRLWGNAPAGYHLVNVLLHATSAVLLLRILRLLRVPGAALAAGVFALHPVHVESVAWISEQKNTLSLVFYLAAMLMYLRFEDGRRRSLYLWATALFVLGLLTKTVVATLPGVLLVLAWWRRGRLTRWDVRPLGVWLVLGAAAGLVTAWFERRLLGAEGLDFALTPPQRAVLAGKAIWFYLGKLLWPVDLAFIYPRWSIDASSWPHYLFPAAVLAVLAALWTLRQRSRAPLAVALVFVGTLLPVLGFVNVYPFVFSFVADHFQYVPSLAIVSAVAAGLALVAERRKVPAVVAATVSLTLLVILGTLTWRRSRAYTDSRTLYETTLETNPGCYLCLNNLGTLSVQAGEMEDAVDRYTRALALKPDSAEAHNNLASALAQAGRVPEAIEHYREAVRVAPNYVVARVNFGSVLFTSGQVAEARAQFEQALRIMPDYQPAQRKLALIQAQESREKALANGSAKP